MERAHVVVPLDGSDHAEQALPYATALARTIGNRITLLAVVDDLGTSEYARRLESLVAEGLRSRLALVAGRLESDGLAVERAVVEGDPTEHILSAADAEPEAIIVMTATGLSDAGRWSIGGVADKVLRLAHCPVLVTRQDARAPVLGSWQPHKVLVALDGSPTAEAALPVAHDLAIAFNAEVLLAHVQPWTCAQLAKYAGYVPDVAALDEEAARMSAAYLETLCHEAPAGARVRNLVLRGNPAEQLIGLAEAESVDVIVLVARTQDGTRPAVLGSVTDRILRSGLTTLVVHPTSSPTRPEQAVDRELAHA